MVNKTSLGFLLTFLLLTTTMRAQSGFVPENIWSNINPSTGLASDYVLDMNGEKLFGEIVRPYNLSDYEKVDFKNNGQVKTYFPGNLKGFGLENGMFFMSKKLPDSEALEFVQIILSGKLQLNHRRGKYYLDNGNEIQELKSFYHVPDGSGTPKRRSIKLYISILKINTAGQCGMALTKLIERSEIIEEDFTQILSKYHECENLPYKLHIENIPLFRLSPTVGLGIGTMFTKTVEADPGTVSQVEDPFSLHIQGGMRFHDFRKSPRLTMDLRVGYSLMSSSWLTSRSTSTRLLFGNQKFSQRSFYFPFSFNYSFYKNNGVDVYAGLIASLMVNKIKTEMGEVDYTYINQQETQLLEMSIIDMNRSLFLPGFKFGTNYPINKKSSVFAEIQGNYASTLYLLNIEQLTRAEYSSLSFSLTMGLKL